MAEHPAAQRCGTGSPDELRTFAG